MPIPPQYRERFKIENLRGKWKELRPEDAFQQLVARVYIQKYSEFVSFPTKGKDGCIDCYGICEGTGERDFFECKYTERSGKQATISKKEERV